MSGEKRTYVSVEERELRRLREQESRLRTVVNDLPERLNAVRQQAEREMMNRIAPLEARQRQYENTVRNLQSDLGNLERETQKRLQKQHNEFMGRLKEQRGEYLQMFQEQDQKFTNMIQDERKQREQAVNNLQNQINAITANAERKQNMARAFVADLSKIMEETNQLPHQRFAPGQFDAIRRHVEDAKRSVEAGMPEAALSTAQKAYWDVADLRILVLQKEKEFMLIYQAALQEARAVLEEARANRKYKLEFGAEKDVIDLEVDHWTNGELSDYENKIQGLEKALADGEKTLSTEQVKEIFAKLERLKPEIAEIVEHAKQNILSSQMRSNIAELVAESLGKQMFSVVDSAYEGDDERNAYVVKLKNIAGSEVVTVISPVEGEFGKNAVSINSYDAGYADDATRMQRAREITEFLNQEGLQTGAPQHIGDARPEYRDISAVRRRKPLEKKL